jgi:membrane protease subunit (stomatin/prohibitin family)
LADTICDGTAVPDGAAVAATCSVGADERSESERRMLAAAAAAADADAKEPVDAGTCADCGRAESGNPGVTTGVANEGVNESDGAR